MGSGGDVSYTSLPIHELLVPFSKSNQNSSLSNSAFAFNDHTEKRIQSTDFCLWLLSFILLNSIHFVSK